MRVKGGEGRNSRGPGRTARERGKTTEEKRAFFRRYRHYQFVRRWGCSPRPSGWTRSGSSRRRRSYRTTMRSTCARCAGRSTSARPAEQLQGGPPSSIGLYALGRVLATDGRLRLLPPAQRGGMDELGSFPLRRRGPDTRDLPPQRAGRRARVRAPAGGGAQQGGARRGGATRFVIQRFARDEQRDDNDGKETLPLQGLPESQDAADMERLRGWLSTGEERAAAGRLVAELRRRRAAVHEPAGASRVRGGCAVPVRLPVIRVGGGRAARCSSSTRRGRRWRRRAGWQKWAGARSWRKPSGTPWDNR